MTRCQWMNLETCSIPSPLDVAPGHLHSPDIGDGQGSPRPWALSPLHCICLGCGEGVARVCPPAAPGASLASHVRIDGLIICTQPFNYPVMATGY